jgi:hypothetical protein
MRTLARERDKAEILRRLKTVGPASVRRWGTMTPPQMIRHLIDAINVAIGKRPASSPPSRVPRLIIKSFALYVPLRWPAGIQTSPELDQAQGGGTTPADFAADVQELEALIDLIATARSGAWPPHPIFGPMSEAAWLRWAYLHADHHLRQFGA